MIYKRPVPAATVINRSPEGGRAAGDNMVQNFELTEAGFVALVKTFDVIREDFVYNITQGNHILSLSIGLMSFEK
jgi:hypothetical protein